MLWNANKQLSPSPNINTNFKMVQKTNIALAQKTCNFGRTLIVYITTQGLCTYYPMSLNGKIPEVIGNLGKKPSGLSPR